MTGSRQLKPSGRWDGESRQTGISGKLGNGGGARGQQRKMLNDKITIIVNL